MKRCVYGTGWIAFMLLTALGKGRAQADFAYRHGTCVVVAWQGDNIAVAADSLSTDDTNGAGYETRKLSKPIENTLVAVTGIAAIIDSRTGAVVWDAKDSADALLKSRRPTSPEDYLLMGEEWMNSVRKLITSRKLVIRGQTEDEVIVQLIVSTRVAKQTRVMVSHFFVRGGQIVWRGPYFVEPPSPTASKVLKYGSCNRYISSTADKSRWLVTERAALDSLEHVERPKAASGDQLRRLALGYVTLANTIDTRLASEGIARSVGPPFLSSSLDLDAGAWTNLTYDH